METSEIQIETPVVEIKTESEWASGPRQILEHVKTAVESNLHRLQYGGVTGKEGTVMEGVVELGIIDTTKETIKPRFDSMTDFDLSELHQVSGQEGSNPGGWFEDKGRNRFYVKFYSDENRLRTEWLANQIYKEVDISVPEVSVRMVNGKLGLASKEVKNLQGLTPGEMSRETDVLNGFVVDAFLGNRDVTGSAFDNILKSPDGHCLRVDNGGTMIFRARGAKKEFPADEIVELDSMREPMYPAGQVFEGITEEEMARQARVFVEKLTDAKIKEIVEAAGIKDPSLVSELQKSLIGRRNIIASRFGLEKNTKPDLEDLKLNEIGNPKILKRLDIPSEQSLNSAKYKSELLGGEIELKNGEAILVKVPPEIRSRVLDSMTLFHRKSEKYRSTQDVKGWDAEGAYTRILVFDADTHHWVSAGPDKYAEHRSAGNPEAEILHDLINTQGKINPEYILVVGAGKGENGIVSFSGLEVDVFPEQQNTKLEMIFSPGTKFVDIQKGVTEPSYGGGEHSNMGVYKGSVPLNNPDISRLEFPITTEANGLLLEKNGRSTGDLHIKIDRKMQFGRIELAIGDTEDWHGKVYKRGETFRRGWAKLTILIERKNGETVNIARRINVPPRGILKGSPDSEISLDVGDQIIIRSEDDASYLMGLRLQ